MKLICAFLSLFIINLYATGYKISVEQVEIVSFNADYIENPVAKLNQFNETSQGISGGGTLKKDIGNDVKGEFLAVRMDGETERPVYNAANIDMCSLLDKNFMGMKDLLKYGNLTECPYKAATYYMNDVMLDFTKLPPKVPTGKYIVKLKLFHGTTEMLSLKASGLLEE